MAIGPGCWRLRRARRGDAMRPVAWVGVVDVTIVQMRMRLPAGATIPGRLSTHPPRHRPSASGLREVSASGLREVSRTRSRQRARLPHTAKLTKRPLRAKSPS
jgi:hypothetical protein